MLKKVIVYLLFLLSFGAVEGYAQLSTTRIKINRGSRFTRTPIVSVQIAAFNVSKMKISNFSDFRDAFWIPYTSRVYGWKLKGAEGKLTVYVKFKYSDNTQSEVFTDDITLDTSKPTGGKIEIHAENDAINQVGAAVKLRLGAENARYVKVSNSRSFYRRRWQILIDSIPDWQLAGNLDGTRMVFAKFRDGAGNISDIVFDRVEVDTQAPVRAAVVINNDEAVTTDAEGKVGLSLRAVGASEMMLSNSSSFEAADWQPYEQKLVWQLEKGSGEKTVYAKFKDKAGNLTEVVSDVISVDNSAPLNGSIIINEGDAVTRQIDGIIELSIKAEEADLMLISNNKDFKGARWQPYEDLITDWRLVGANGKKQVYIKFKDEAGNESEVYSDDIILIR